MKVNNKPSNKYAKQMQDEANRMADKLAQLKSSLNSQKLDRSIVSEQSDLQKSTRWESNTPQVLKERKPSNKQEPIEQFLKSIKLDNYVEKFKENGFEELDILLDIQKEQLQQMEIPLVHQIRLMKKIKELKSNFQNEQNEQINDEQESKYEELEQPEFDESFSTVQKKSNIKKQRGKSAKKVQFQNIDNNNDQEQNYQMNHSFLLDQLEEISNYIHQHHFDESSQDIGQQTVELFTQIQDNNTQNNNFDRLQQQSNNCNQGELLRIKKVACWNCYKLIEKDFIIENGNEYCNKICFQKYNELYQTSCQKCQQIFDLREGVILNGCSLCSNECANEFDFQLMKDSVEIIRKQFNNNNSTITIQEKMDQVPQYQEKQENYVNVDLNFD